MYNKKMNSFKQSLDKMKYEISSEIGINMGLNEISNKNLSCKTQQELTSITKDIKNKSIHFNQKNR